MYSLDKVDKTANAIINYVKQCMKEKKIGATEVKEYERQCKQYGFDHLLTISQEYIDMLNNMEQNQECKVTYLW